MQVHLNQRHLLEAEGIFSSCTMFQRLVISVSPEGMYGQLIWTFLINIRPVGAIISQMQHILKSKALLTNVYREL